MTSSSAHSTNWLMECARHALCTPRKKMVRPGGGRKREGRQQMLPHVSYTTISKS